MCFIGDMISPNIDFITAIIWSALKTIKLLRWPFRVWSHNVTLHKFHGVGWGNFKKLVIKLIPGNRGQFWSVSAAATATADAAVSAVLPSTFQLSRKTPEADFVKPHMVNLLVWEKKLTPISVTLGQSH